MTETVTAARKLDVVVFEAPGLGDRSYLLHDGAKAVVVDPKSCRRQRTTSSKADVSCPGSAESCPWPGRRRNSSSRRQSGSGATLKWPLFARWRSAANGARDHVF